MSYVVCLEEMEGRWIAHVPALLGCYAEEDTREAALAAAPTAIVNYVEHLHAAGEPVPVLEEQVEAHVDEIMREWVDPLQPANQVNAFFAVDATPLTTSDVARAVQLLQRNRLEQRAALEHLSVQEIEQPVENGWSIQRILQHIGRAEWWYLTRLDLEPTVPRPNDWEGCQDVVRTRLVDVLPTLVDVAQIMFKDNELWSPRKLLRRALWHEPDHTQHIRRFKMLLASKQSG